MRTIQIELPKLHKTQAQVRRDFAGARFGVLACGRRWGKTRLAAALCVERALAGGRVWWVAPSYKMALVGWRTIRALATHVPFADVRRGELSVSFAQGGEVRVRSADDPDSLRGEGLDFVALDECAFMHEDVWFHALRPALSDRSGRALFISTPKGRNWFWRLWQWGQDPEQKEWRSWRFPTSANPHIPGGEIDSARQILPEYVFRQEYEAEFIDAAGGVFRNVMDVADARPAAPVGGRTYVVGVDWGKHNDFTVFVVLDVEQRSMVRMDRFNQIDYIVQVGRLQALAELYRPQQIVVERNSMGDPLVEQLQRMDLPVVPFTTTHATKTALIDALALAFERKEIRILPDPALVAELQAFEMERLPSGTFRYSAPEGVHDDTVMALALAWHGVQSLEKSRHVWSVF